MSSDIVERLRAAADRIYPDLNGLANRNLLTRAADEIERLRAEVESWTPREGSDQ